MVCFLCTIKSKILINGVLSGNNIPFRVKKIKVKFTNSVDYTNTFQLKKKKNKIENFLVSTNHVRMSV